MAKEYRYDEVVFSHEAKMTLDELKARLDAALKLMGATNEQATFKGFVRRDGALRAVWSIQTPSGGSAKVDTTIPRDHWRPKQTNA